jgi:hypothetical protein
VQQIINAASRLEEIRIEQQQAKAISQGKSGGAGTKM